MVRGKSSYRVRDYEAYFTYYEPSYVNLKKKYINCSRDLTLLQFYCVPNISGLLVEISS